MPSDAEAEIRAVIARWTKAVRDQDLAGIEARHDSDMLMFDVPPPFKSTGLEAYMKTWATFFEWATRPIEFDLTDLNVVVGDEVAFATAMGHCAGTASGRGGPLDFRLTIGFCKRGGQWRIVHEHHSLPAKH